MSFKDTDIKEKQPENKPYKTSLLQMQGKLTSKKTVSFKQPIAQKAKAQSVREVDSDDEDFPRFKKLKTDEDKDKISTRKSMITGTDFLDKVLFEWMFDIIKKVQTNTLAVEDFGGLRDEDMIQGKIKMVEENFEKQFLAVFQVFKWNYYYNFIDCGIHLVIHIFFPMIVEEIIRFMQDKEDTNLFYGFKLLVLLVALNCFLMLINVHIWYNNITTGCLSHKILTAMTVKTFHCDEQELWSWTDSQCPRRPSWTNMVLLRSEWLLHDIHLDLLLYNPIVHDHRMDIHHRPLPHGLLLLLRQVLPPTDEGHEARGSEGISKFYGWDKNFQNEILKIRAEQIAKQESTQSIMLILSFVWKFLRNLVSVVNFSVFLTMGNNLDLP